MAKEKMTLEEKLEDAIVKDAPYEVPGNWVWSNIGSFTNVKSSKRILATEYKELGVPFYRSKEIVELSLNKEVSSEVYISIERYEEICDKFGMPQQGDLLITSVGTIGRTWIVDDRKFYYKDGNITQIDKNEVLNTMYVRRYIESPYFDIWVKDTVSGSAYNALTIDKLKSLAIPVPPLNEQKRIVDRIESLFEKLDKAKELIEEAREGFEKRKSASMYKILNIDTAEKIPLNKCIKFVTEKKDPEDGDAYIGLEDIKKASGIISYSIAKDVKSTKTKFKAGDVLYGRLRPYLNKHDVVDRDGICSTDILVMRPNDGYNSRYINYMLDTLEFIRYSNENASGINLPRVSSKVVGEYLIPNIKLDRQIEVVRIFDGIYQKEREIEELTQLEEKIELIKKSILAKAFRGELGTNWEKDESALELLKEILSRQ